MPEEFKKVLEMINSWWAKSMVAIILCVIFRVDIQAFSCQRKL